MRKRQLCILVMASLFVMMSGCKNNEGVDSKTEPESTVVETAAVPQAEMPTPTMDVNEEIVSTPTADTNVEITGVEEEAEQKNTDETENNNESETGKDFYAVCTKLSKAEVEGFASTVKQEILDKDWKGLSEKIAYPITIGNTTYKSSVEFAAADFDVKLSNAFMEAVGAESCKEMFCNAKGIMLGENGEIWISEVLNEDMSSQGLKVIAINGMVEE